MTKITKKVIGVDVSSKELVMSLLDESNREDIIKVTNTQTAIEQKLKNLDKQQYKIIVEATGTYSSKILYYAYKQGFEVYQVSGLSIKKFAEAKNQISKTDPLDSRLIRIFGETMELSAFEPKKENMELLDQELNLWQDLEKEKRRLTLKLQALKQRAVVNKEVVKHYESLIKGLNKEIENIKKRLPQHEDAELKQSKKLLKSICGIGDKTALFLIVATNNFKNFTSAKSLAKYFGVAPRMYHSGNKKVTIGKCRTSKGLIRSILYICSWSAARYNEQCKALYERVLEKRKCKNLALIAVCNKLLRQAFGVLKNKLPYQKNYSKNICLLT